MIQLGCNYSKPLMSLLAEGEVDLDWIKLSREDTLLQEVEECRAVRPALVHTLGLAGVRPEAFAAIDWDLLNEAIRVSRSPHIAIHLQSRVRDWDLALEPSQVDDATAQLVVERMITQIRAAQERLEVPLLLENVPAHDNQQNLWLCGRTDTINHVLEETGTLLLLDTAHLRCAAYHLGIDPYEYALALPLDRVREIHVTTATMVAGEGLQDLHRAMEEEDYALLQWLLERTPGTAIVTLEYGGTGPVYEQPGMTEPDALKRQLGRLKGMLA